MHPVGRTLVSNSSTLGKEKPQWKSPDWNTSEAGWIREHIFGTLRYTGDEECCAISIEDQVMSVRFLLSNFSMRKRLQFFFGKGKKL
jgi:hypothetical protein